MADEFHLQQEAVDELKAKLKYLRTTRRNEVAEKIKEAKSFGDLSENSEYDEAKSEQGKLEAEITEIEYQLQHVKIIDESSLSTDTVHIGSYVTVYDPEFNEENKYQIVGFPQANPIENKISDESPIGKGLLGCKVGDTVEIETPSGMMKLEIKKIEKY
ncbi:MAG: transcription elongation factor GreA [Clostridiales bacterium]|nr:transcription elongation factor GreA [Clostridiales bacterium]MCD7827148.1 transcription elongation factor GreA [Clostridiales bacterium]